MSLKIRDFANGLEENVSGRVKEERRYREDEDVLSYDPPGGSRRRRDSRGSGSQRSDSRSPPRYGSVPRGARDEKPYFGPRDPEGNIQVSCVSERQLQKLKTGFLEG